VKETECSENIMYSIMYENEKMRHAETIPEMGAGRDK
jgi:hypothetical protein